MYHKVSYFIFHHQVYVEPCGKLIVWLYDMPDYRCCCLYGPGDQLFWCLCRILWWCQVTTGVVYIPDIQHILQYIWNNKVNFYFKAIMHSSRMHTAHLLAVSPSMHCSRRGVWCLLPGASAPGGCLLRGVVSQHALGQIPLWTESQTCVKT